MESTSRDVEAPSILLEKTSSTPPAQMSSPAMLLRYCCILVDEAAAIEASVFKVLADKRQGKLEIRISDMGGKDLPQSLAELYLSFCASR
ncbi:hypothetical protein MY4824_007754 [Beauveria thailandica]